MSLAMNVENELSVVVSESSPHRFPRVWDHRQTRITCRRYFMFAVAAVLCSGSILWITNGRRQGRLSQDGLYESLYFQEPESGTSRAWKALFRKLRSEANIPSPRGRSGVGASATSDFHIRALPFDIGYEAPNETAKTADHNTTSNNSEGMNISSIMIQNRTNHSITVAADFFPQNVSNASVASVARTPSTRGNEEAALIRDGEKRERLETVDTEGQIISATSRAWHSFLHHLRHKINTTYSVSQYLREQVAFKLKAPASDIEMKTSSYPPVADGSGKCSCGEGERITSPSCGGTGDRRWRVYGFWYLYSNEGCEACRTCLGGEYILSACDGSTWADTTVCEQCNVCQAGERLAGEACSGTGKEDTQECVTCEEGYFCSGGNAEARACRTSCEPGFLLVGQCPPASAIDNTSCVLCPEGFFCFDGQKTACTSCSEGEYIVGEPCQAGSTEDTQTCATCSACSEGEFIAGSICAGNSTIDSTDCTQCKTCAPGEYRSLACDGSGTNDSVVCDKCDTCAPGEYLMGTPCDGSGEENSVTCKACTQCSEGHFVTGTPCTGGAWEDTQACNECQVCAEGEYISGSACLGNSSIDSQQGTCVKCHEGACPAGFYSMGLACDGRGLQDTMRCQPCATCKAGEYQAGTPCDGSGSEDTSLCKKCTSCGKGEYVSGECTGRGDKDTQTCVPCSQCPAGTVVSGECLGDGTADTQSCLVWASVAGQSCNYACDMLFLDCSDNQPMTASTLSEVASKLGVSCDEIKDVADEGLEEDKEITPFLQVPPWDTPSTSSPFHGTGLCLFSQDNLDAHKWRHRCGLKKASAVRICSCKQPPPGFY